MTKKSRLGRGIDALIPPKQIDNTINGWTKTIEIEKEVYGVPLLVDIDKLCPNTHQPRKHFDEKELQSLSQSIKSQGIIEPLVVLDAKNDIYEIIAGERRWKAAIIAGLKQVPVIIRNISDDPSERLVLALIENLCREDLNPIEEAESFAKLEKEFNKTHQEIASLSGRERPTVTNSVRLLKLPDFIQDDVRLKRISAGHGRAMLGLNDQSLFHKVRTEVITKKLTVRQTEALIRKLNKKPKLDSSDKFEKEAYFEALAQSFTNKLGGLKVKINYASTNKKLEIYYNNNEELEIVMKKLGIDVH